MKEIIKLNNNNYPYLEEDVTSECHLCGKKINGEPIEVDKTTMIDDEIREITHMLFCSRECEYLDLVDTIEHRLMGDLKKIINHLIKIHCCDIAILENALNSENGKRIRMTFELGDK